jgi:glycosyltransferase involved in cell wall biosynthesis
MKRNSSHQNENGNMRVLRIAHASLTPALRRRERAFQRRYPDVDLQVITSRRWREAEMDVEATADDLFPVRIARTYLSKHIQLFAYDPRPIIAALREHRPHVIELNHEPYSVACAEVLTLCKWFAPGASIVIQACQNIHHNYPPPFNWLEQRAFRRMHAGHSCSETVREVLRAKGLKKLVEIIPFGVDADAFQPRSAAQNDSDQGPTIGYIGRLLPGKGLNLLADSLGKLKSLPWQLLVVGDGPEREEFEGKLRASGLLDRVEFTGAITYDLIPEYFKRLDVLVIPTQTTKRIREQFGRVIVEAMASGVPVIGSTCGAIPEVIGDAGLTFPDGDADALAEALRRMVSDPELRQHLARAGRQRVEQHYSWDHVADLTYHLFQKVLTTRQEPAVRRALATSSLVILGLALSLGRLFL